MAGIWLVGTMISCVDGVQNGNEEGLDCGGPNCEVTCEEKNRHSGFSTVQIVLVVSASVVCAGATYIVLFTPLCRCCCAKKASVRRSSIVVDPAKTQAVIAEAGRRASITSGLAAAVRRGSMDAPRRTSLVVVRPMTAAADQPAMGVSSDPYGNSGTPSKEEPQPQPKRRASQLQSDGPPEHGRRRASTSGAESAGNEEPQQQPKRRASKLQSDGPLEHGQRRASTSGADSAAKSKVAPIVLDDDVEVRAAGVVDW